MFIKHGAIFSIVSNNFIKSASEWTDVKNKVSTAEGIVIHKNLEPTDDQRVVCQIDPDNYIYIHTTIMASVNLEPNSDYYITKDTEKYINTNGDAWTKDELLNDYQTFITNGTVYVEHDQNPERAKGKVLDAVPRDMGDTVLIDLLFCVDKRHEDLVHNIETGLANAVSMGCTTKYTVCSICGNVAHDEKEYCIHIKNKNQVYKCADGKYRKACELCYKNTFYDCSIVANPAFAGAVFRKLVASDKVSMQLLSNILCRSINSMDFQNEVAKIAAMHPSEKEQNVDYIPEDVHADIPYTDPHNVLEKFDEQQEESVIDAGKGKKKTAKCEDYGSLVILNSRYDIPSSDRKASDLFNFLSEKTVGRLIAKVADTCAIYFPRVGMIKNIPVENISKFSIQDYKDQLKKCAKKYTDDDISIERQGTIVDTDDKFQVLKKDDDGIEVRWIEGSKLGTKEKLPKSMFTEGKIKWASVNKLVAFSGKWNGRYYQFKSANWNEKQAQLLDKYENHIDNVQHDIMCIKPKQASRKYDKSFCINTKLNNTLFKFQASIKDDNINIDVDATMW